jgi:hypothetical protein
MGKHSGNCAIWARAYAPGQSPAQRERSEQSRKRASGKPATVTTAMPKVTKVVTAEDPRKARNRAWAERLGIDPALLA